MTTKPDPATDPHTEANRETARKLREEITPRPVAVPTVTSTRCPNTPCQVFLLSDGQCPRCNPRTVAPGPK